VADGELERRVAAIRRFNRFYTRRIGVLHDHLYGSPYTLAQVRVLYEIAHREGPTASELGRDLGLDPGYLSRILRGFERRGLVRRTAAPSDGRKSHLALTDRGRAALAPLDRRARASVAALLEGRSGTEQERVVEAMRAIEEALGEAPSRRETCFLRLHGPGDLGWIVHRHGFLYARERGWDERFEALVAGVAAGFLRGHDPERERCWIAERNGERVGSVLLVAKSRIVAQLRLLLVEPEARGHGIGGSLVEECLRFAREAGYRKVVLWTDGGLHAARRLYERAGFAPTREERHRDFGHDLVAQTWELKL